MSRTPQGCWITKVVSAPCQNCDARPKYLHISRENGGPPRMFCVNCCPLCTVRQPETAKGARS